MQLHVCWAPHSVGSRFRIQYILEKSSSWEHFEKGAVQFLETLPDPIFSVAVSDEKLEQYKLRGNTSFLQWASFSTGEWQNVLCQQLGAGDAEGDSELSCFGFYLKKKKSSASHYSQILVFIFSTMFTRFLKKVKIGPQGTLLVGL